MSKAWKRPGKPRPTTRSGQSARRQPTQRAANPRRVRIATIGKTLAWTGGILFVLGNIGARTGWVLFPFDSHHVISQFGGIALLIVGVALTGRR